MTVIEKFSALQPELPTASPNGLQLKSNRQPAYVGVAATHRPPTLEVGNGTTQRTPCRSFGGFSSLHPEELCITIASLALTYSSFMALVAFQSTFYNILPCMSDYMRGLNSQLQLTLALSLYHTPAIHCGTHLVFSVCCVLTSTLVTGSKGFRFPNCPRTSAKPTLG